jgi:hypothetical protein
VCRWRHLPLRRPGPGGLGAAGGPSRCHIVTVAARSPVPPRRGGRGRRGGRVHAEPPQAGAADRAQASPVLRHTLELHERGIHVSYEEGWPRTAGKHQRPQEPADSARDMDESCARARKVRS